jgi:nitrogen fixation protein
MRPEARNDCAGEDHLQFNRPKVMSRYVVELKERLSEPDWWWRGGMLVAMNRVRLRLSHVPTVTCLPVCVCVRAEGDQVLQLRYQTRGLVLQLRYQTRGGCNWNVYWFLSCSFQGSQRTDAGLVKWCEYLRKKQWNVVIHGAFAVLGVSGWSTVTKLGTAVNSTNRYSQNRHLKFACIFWQSFIIWPIFQGRFITGRSGPVIKHRILQLWLWYTLSGT